MINMIETVVIWFVFGIMTLTCIAMTLFSIYGAIIKEGKTASDYLIGAVGFLFFGSISVLFICESIKNIA